MGRGKTEDLSGRRRPLRRVRWDICGEYVQDMGEILSNGKTLRKQCANGGYFTVK